MIIRNAHIRSVLPALIIVGAQFGSVRSVALPRLPASMLARVATDGSAKVTATGTRKSGTPTQSRSPLSYPAVSFVSARMGWVLATRGTSAVVIHTSDAGRSWTRLAHFPLPSAAPLTMQFVDSRHGWISAIGPSRCGGLKVPFCSTVLFRTVDGARHWSRLTIPSMNAGAVTFLDPFHGWLWMSHVPCTTICPQTLYATVDGGITWHPLRGAPRYSWGTSMSWVSPLRGWVGGGNLHSCTSSIFATTDGGRTWKEQLALPKHCGTIELGMLDDRRGWAVGGMASQYCAMGGCNDYTLYRTVDGGRHWITELVPARNWWAVSGATGGFPEPPLFVTPDYGWISFGTGAGPGDGGIAITTNGGRTWRRVLPSYSLGPSAVALINPYDGWISSSSRLCQTPSCNAALTHTTNGGKTWSQVHARP